MTEEIYTFDLLSVPADQVLPILNWCWEHNIDRKRCIDILQSCLTKEYVDWEIRMNEKQAMWFTLKWS